jgi:uncharacterized protein (DUF427 family)
MALTLEQTRLANDPLPADRILLEPSPRRVRVVFGNATIADSQRVLMMMEGRQIALYYFPREDVQVDVLEPSGHTREDRNKGAATLFDVRLGDRTAHDAAWSYNQPLPDGQDMTGYVAFEWGKMDAWFEEDEEVFVHPRHPYHRIDVLHSSRKVRVEFGGEIIAETRQPRLLFETGLPTRYYIPKVDVRMEKLVRSVTHTGCPYKGTASYWSVRVGDQVIPDLVWTYPNPHPESYKIENLLAFYNEKVDIYVDGVLQPRPKTRWS